MKQRDVFWDLLGGAQQRLLRRGKRHHPLTAGILVLVLVAQFGCASSGSDKKSALAPLSPPPGEAALKVAVTSGRFAPEFDIVGAPWKGGVRGALKGGLEGFFAPLMFAAYCLFPCIAVIAPLMPVGLVAGAIEGAKAEPAVKLEERETIARKMIASQRIQDEFRDRVVAIGRGRTPHTLMVLADRGPTAVDERPDYRSLSQEGIQAVLEVVVESVTLKSHIGDLGLVMTVKTRTVRTVDNAEIYVDSLTYTDNGQTQTLLAGWVGQKGFQNELNRAYTDIAERIVEEIFLRTESN